MYNSYVEWLSIQPTLALVIHVNHTTSIDSYVSVGSLSRFGFGQRNATPTTQIGVIPSSHIIGF